MAGVQDRRREKKGTPFAQLRCHVVDYADGSRSLITDLSNAGFYILAERRGLPVLAPPFVHIVNPEATVWTFKQWRPGHRPKNGGL